MCSNDSGDEIPSPGRVRTEPRANRGSSSVRFAIAKLEPVTPPRGSPRTHPVGGGAVQRRTRAFFPGSVHRGERTHGCLDLARCASARWRRRVSFRKPGHARGETTWDDAPFARPRPSKAELHCVARSTAEQLAPNWGRRSSESETVGCGRCDRNSRRERRGGVLEKQAGVGRAKGLRQRARGCAGPRGLAREVGWSSEWMCSDFY